jgi:hypothetical protein
MIKTKTPPPMYISPSFRRGREQSGVVADVPVSGGGNTSPCGREDSNLQEPFGSTGPKPAASASSATPARFKDRAGG